MEDQAQPPGPPEETETSPIQQEALSPPSEILKEAGNSVHQQEAPAETSSSPEEVESSSVQQEASAKPTEAPEEVEPWTPQEAPAQHPEPSEVVPQPIAHEVNVPSRNQNEAQQPGFRNVTVKPADLALTVTLAQPPERPEESEPSPIQQEAPVQPAERPEEAGPTPVQLEAPAQSAERLEDVGPTPVCRSSQL